MESDESCSSQQYNKKRGKYNQITLEQRKNFIKRTLCEGLTMKAAAELENINYKSAFVILKCYKKYGRIGKKQTRERKIKSQKKNFFHQKKISIQVNNNNRSIHNQAIDNNTASTKFNTEIKQEFQQIYQVNFKNINENDIEHITVCKIENDVFANYYKNQKKPEDSSFSQINTPNIISDQQVVSENSAVNNFSQRKMLDSIQTSSLNFAPFQQQQQYYDMVQNNMMLMRYSYLLSQLQQQPQKLLQQSQSSQFCNVINASSIPKYF